MNLNYSPLVFDILSFIKYTDEYDENFTEEKDYEKVSLQSGITVGIFDRQYFDKKNKPLSFFYEIKVKVEPKKICVQKTLQKVCDSF